MSKEGSIEILKYIIPAVMIGIALNQVRLVYSSHLTPWKGGGFGMFSCKTTTDTRVLVCIGIDENGKEVRLWPKFENLNNHQWSDYYLQRLHASPSLEELQHISNALIEKKFVKRLNNSKHLAGLNLGWQIEEYLFEPLIDKSLKVANEATYTFPTVVAAIYELRYNSQENSVKYHELIKYRTDRS